MNKDYQTKSLGHQVKGAGHTTQTPLEASITNHEQALADAQARADRAETALQEYRTAELRAFQAQRRPGELGFYLQPDARREELERQAVAARAEVTRLEGRLTWLQGMLPKP